MLKPLSSLRTTSSVCSAHYFNGFFYTCLSFCKGISRPVVRTERIRSLATATAEVPVRRYGGLKDQDRIFTNAYCRHDHGIKGAMVIFSPRLFRVEQVVEHHKYSRVVIGTSRKTFCSKVIHGLFKLLKIRVYGGEEGLVFLAG